MHHWIEITNLSPAQWAAYFQFTQAKNDGPIVSSLPPLAGTEAAFHHRRILSLTPLKGKEFLLFQEKKIEAWLRINIVVGRLQFSIGGGKNLEKPEVRTSILGKVNEAMISYGANHAWMEAHSPNLLRFAKAIGAIPSETKVYLELEIEAANWPTLERWRKEIPAKNPGFSLAIYRDRPDEMLDAYIQLYETVSRDRPRSDQNGPPFGSWSRQELRTLNVVNQEIGRTSITLLALNEAGMPVALTDINLDLYHPERAYQGMTGVLPAFQGRGFARWLKAEALFKLKTLFPALKKLDSDTHRDNAAMLRLNLEMGFRHLGTGADFRLPRVVAHAAPPG